MEKPIKKFFFIANLMIPPIPSSLQSPIKSTRTWISIPKYKRRDHWESYSHLPSIPKSLTLVILLFWDKKVTNNCPLKSWQRRSLRITSSSHSNQDNSPHSARAPNPLQLLSTYTALYEQELLKSHKRMWEEYGFFFSKSEATASNQYWGGSQRLQTSLPSSSYLVRTSKGYLSAFPDHHQVEIKGINNTHYHLLQFTHV